MSSKTLERLASVGIVVTDLGHLLKWPEPYPEAIPILLQGLREATDRVDAEFHVRALTCPEAAEQALPVLVRMFGSIPDRIDPPHDLLRWAIGNAIDALWDDRFVDEVLAYVGNPEFGHARQMLARGLRKSKDTRVVATLLAVMNQEDVSGHATEALARLAPPEARSALEEKLDDRRAWVRRAAARGLKKIDAVAAT